MIILRTTSISIPISFLRPNGYTKTRTRWNISRRFTTTPVSLNSNYDIPIDKIRNIGIIAHIDAGKTTTTERMLYYAGYTKRIGDVDDGSTVTDFLPAERERGITIQSACIPFAWKDHRINLIDTPGHVDFTIEVERAIRVLDGAICILDGVSGVQAQTETVWNQANRYHVPRIIFINKLDREGSNIARVMRTVESRLGALQADPLCPLLTQWPITTEEGTHGNKDGRGGPGLVGLVDLLEMKALSWSSDPKTGSVISTPPLESFTSVAGDSFMQEVRDARAEFVEKVAELDDEFLDMFLGPKIGGDPFKLTSADPLKSAIRRITLANKGVPVLLGASFKNMGVQPVMDAVLDYLPSPKDKAPPLAHIKNSSDTITIQQSEDSELMMALAFKVVHDPRRGPLVFSRVYSGKLTPRATLINTSSTSSSSPSTKPSGEKERVNKLLQMYADDYEELPYISAGNIGALVGLTKTRTGDTLVSDVPQSIKIDNNRKIKTSELQLESIQIPSPVFVCSIEPNSLSDEKPLDEALKMLQREDPSIHVQVDEETGQTLVSGMGELHLEIVRDRLRAMKVNCSMSSVRISYRETILSSEDEVISGKYCYEVDLFGKKAKVEMALELSVLPKRESLNELGDQEIFVKDENKITIDIDPKSILSTGSSSPSPSSSTYQLPTGYPQLSEIHAAIQNGIETGLSRGPVLNSPLTNIHVRVTSLTLFAPDLTSTSAIRTTAIKTLQSILHQQTVSKTILEPIMDVDVTVPNEYVGNVTRDLSGHRRGHILQLGNDADSSSEVDPMMSKTLIKARVPLQEIVGYSSHLRSLTAGTGSFVMKLCGYGIVQGDKQEAILKEIRGY